MDSVRNYLIAVVAVCMISVLAAALVHNSPLNKIVRFVSGILILLVAASPLLTLDTDLLAEKMEKYLGGRSFRTDEIQENTRQQLALHIKETTETYIENKAAELGAAIQAEVTLDNGEYPTPNGATIIGTLTPTQRTALAAYLTDSLAIPAEQQEWKLYGTTE